MEQIKNMKEAKDRWHEQIRNGKDAEKTRRKKKEEEEW